jgi:uncharacterized protein with GYD domain
MATYVSLSTFTEQGLKGIKDTVKRSEAYKEAAKAAGITVKEILWTQGQYDIVLIAEAPDDATISALALNLAKMGNVRGQTLRAFTAAEMTKILRRSLSRHEKGRQPLKGRRPSSGRAEPQESECGTLP